MGAGDYICSVLFTFSYGQKTVSKSAILALLSEKCNFGTFAGKCYSGTIVEKCCFGTFVGNVLFWHLANISNTVISELGETYVCASTLYAMRSCEGAWLVEWRWVEWNQVNGAASSE